MEKYILLKNDTRVFNGITLYRIKYLKDGKYFRKGELGGYIDEDSAFSQEDECCILGNATVINSSITGNVVIEAGKVEDSILSGKTTISGEIKGSIIYGNIKCDTSYIRYSSICGNCGFKNSTIEYSNLKNASIYFVNIYALRIISKSPVKISSEKDYLQFKNWWSSGRYFNYIPKLKLWFVGCFIGTHDELIAKAYKDSKDSGDHYKATVELVRNMGL